MFRQLKSRPSTSPTHSGCWAGPIFPAKQLLIVFLVLFDFPQFDLFGGSPKRSGQKKESKAEQKQEEKQEQKQKQKQEQKQEQKQKQKQEQKQGAEAGGEA